MINSEFVQGIVIDQSPPDSIINRGGKMLSLEGICVFFSELDITNTPSVVIMAIATCIFIVSIIKAVYITYVEELFMSPKSKRRNMFFRVLALLIIIIIVNFTLIGNNFYLPIAILGSMGGMVIYFVCQWKKTLTEKYPEDIERLTQYYEEKSYNCVLLAVVTFMPLLAYIMNKSYSYISLINCVIMVSVVEVFVICLITPELVKSTSQYYFIKDGKEWYIYERTNEDIVICGDNPVESKSKKIITINYEEFIKKELIRVHNQGFSKEMKKQLKSKLKDNRRIAKIAQEDSKKMKG